MMRYLSVLLSVLALTLIVNDPAAYAVDQPELTIKQIKRIARKIADKREKKQINKILLDQTKNIATEAVTTPKIAIGAVTTSEIADEAITAAKLQDKRSMPQKSLSVL